MTDRIGDFQDDHLIGKQSKRPSTKAFWRRTATCSDEFCLLNAVELFRNGRQATLFAIQSCFETFRDQLFADIDDRLDRHPGQFADFFVGPVRPVGIRLEQHDGTFDFLRRSFQFFDDAFEFPAFLIGQPNDLFFRIHDKSSVCWGDKMPKQ